MRQITFEVRSPASVLALMLSPIDHPGPEVMRKKEGMEATNNNRKQQFLFRKEIPEGTQASNALKASELKFFTSFSLRTSNFPHEIEPFSLHKSNSLHKKDSAACYTSAQSVMSAMPLPLTNRKAKNRQYKYL